MQIRYRVRKNVFCVGIGLARAVHLVHHTVVNPILQGILFDGNLLNSSYSHDYTS